MQPCVYILASKRNRTLYVGVTSDLLQRVWPHKEDLVEASTKRYGMHTLRKWKLELIEKTNPEWSDVYPTLL